MCDTRYVHRLQRSDLESVAASAQRVLSKLDKLDVLLNNAGFDGVAAAAAAAMSDRCVQRNGAASWRDATEH